MRRWPSHQPFESFYLQAWTRCQRVSLRSVAYYAFEFSDGATYESAAWGLMTVSTALAFQPLLVGYASGRVQSFRQRYQRPFSLGMWAAWCMPFGRVQASLTKLGCWTATNIHSSTRQPCFSDGLLNQSQGGMCIYNTSVIGLGFSQKSFGL